MIQGRFPESKKDSQMIPLIQGRLSLQRSAKFNVSNGVEFGGSMGGVPYMYVCIYRYLYHSLSVYLFVYLFHYLSIYLLVRLFLEA